MQCRDKMEEAMQFLAATEAHGERVDLKEAAVHVESHRSNVWRELKKLQTSGAWTELEGGAAKGSQGLWGASAAFRSGYQV